MLKRSTMWIVTTCTIITFARGGSLFADDCYSSWFNVGISGVSDLAVYGDGPTEALYAAGGNLVRRWLGTGDCTWEQVGIATKEWADPPEIAGTVYALATVNGMLYAAGEFDLIRRYEGGSPVHVHGVAKFDGTSWHPAEDVPFLYRMRQPVKTLFAAGNELYAASAWPEGGGTPEEAWVGKLVLSGEDEMWLELMGLDRGFLDSSGSGVINDMVMWQHESETYLVVAGAFEVCKPDEPYESCLYCDDTQGPRIRNLAKMASGFEWSRAGGGGVNGTVYSLVVLNNDLYVGGRFTTAYDSEDDRCSGAGKAVNYVARWNGSEWTDVGNGFDPGEYVHGLVVFDDGTGEALYAGTTKGLYKRVGEAWEDRSPVDAPTALRGDLCIAPYTLVGTTIWTTGLGGSVGAWCGCSGICAGYEETNWSDSSWEVAVAGWHTVLTSKPTTWSGYICDGDPYYFYHYHGVLFRNPLEEYIPDPYPYWYWWGDSTRYFKLKDGQKAARIDVTSYYYWSWWWGYNWASSVFLRNRFTQGIMVPRCWDGGLPLASGVGPQYFAPKELHICSEPCEEIIDWCDHDCGELWDEQWTWQRDYFSKHTRFTDGCWAGCSGGECDCCWDWEEEPEWWSWYWWWRVCLFRDQPYGWSLIFGDLSVLGTLGMGEPGPYQCRYVTVDSASVTVHLEQDTGFPRELHLEVSGERNISLESPPFEVEAILRDCDGWAIGNPIPLSIPSDDTEGEFVQYTLDPVQIPLTCGNYPRRIDIRGKNGCSLEDGFQDLYTLYVPPPDLTPGGTPLSQDTVDCFSCDSVSDFAPGELQFYKSTRDLYGICDQVQDGPKHGEVANGEFRPTARRSHGATILPEGLLYVMVDDANSPAEFKGAKADLGDPTGWHTAAGASGHSMTEEGIPLDASEGEIFKFNVLVGVCRNVSTLPLSFDWYWWDTRECCFQHERGDLSLRVEPLPNIPAIVNPVNPQGAVWIKSDGSEDIELQIPACPQVCASGSSGPVMGSLSRPFVAWPERDGSGRVLDGHALGWKIVGRTLISPEPEAKAITISPASGQ